MRLIFLVYVPRSGSTLLSRLLSEALGKCVVVPELRVTREIFRAEGAAGRPLDADGLRRLVASDHQAASLGLDDDQWERCFTAADGEGAERFLEEVARTAADGREIEAAIFKCGSLRHFWPEVQRLCRRPEGIHIYRDPRGVVSSTMRSERPHHQGRRMGRGDPWFITRRWVAGMDWARRASLEDPRFHEVKFEDVCSHGESTLAKLIQTANLDADGHGPTLSIDPRESAIHRKIHQVPDNARNDAWAEELPPKVGRLVEWLAGPMLEDRGYEPHFTVDVPPIRRHLALGKAWVAGRIRAADHHLWVRSRRGSVDRDTR